MCSGNLRRFGVESNEISGVCAGALAARIAARGANKRSDECFIVCSSLGVGCLTVRMQNNLLHAPGCNFRGIKLILAAAIQLVDGAELARLLAGFSELAHDRAIQFHLEDV